jgi:pimeloyl-ACP methyl ester carboxylesterase
MSNAETLPVEEETLTWEPPGKFTSCGTHYILEGGQDQPLVVCIHGIGSYYFYFDGLARSLVAAGYRVLRYDLIGRGHSKPADSYDRSAHLLQLQTLLKELGLTNVPRHVIGHSMGGALALLHADEDPVPIASLTLLSPAGLMDGAIFTALRVFSCLHGPISSALHRGLESKVRDDFHGDDPAITRLADATVRRIKLMIDHNPHAFPAFFSTVVHFPLSGLAPDARRVAARPGRILLYWGECDIVVPASNLARWRAALAAPGARATLEVEVAPAGGHAFFLERPDAAAARILAFLAASSAPPAAGPPAAPAAAAATAASDPTVTPV